MISSAPGQSMLGGGREDPRKPLSQFDPLKKHYTEVSEDKNIRFFKLSRIVF